MRMPMAYAHMAAGEAAVAPRPLFAVYFPPFMAPDALRAVDVHVPALPAHCRMERRRVPIQRTVRAGNGNNYMARHETG